MVLKHLWLDVRVAWTIRHCGVWPASRSMERWGRAPGPPQAAHDRRNMLASPFTVRTAQGCTVHTPHALITKSACQAAVL